ncbi:non-specific lipid-transfer protein D, cotyledon-specific isoform [Cajanus cajan]|uniref:Bifunctional inhibitor/plant lipid transfer protein/seed storage helical domain-containing protein n=1 Tax=Cajanus cajan TaxID=3821 RepID=A0A151R247_CAJCA|nr:non-specific lipid-transfer protein D, cotyledon-specific isoform [Cajanus cajan]KYP36637.1 hypothetical protein KK1_042229 [Cajanus cajan]
MGEKKVLSLVMFVMAYGLAVTTLTASEGRSECSGYEPLTFQCGSYLISRDPMSTPSDYCCDGARVGFQLANTPKAIKNLCTCFVKLIPYVHLQPQKIVQLPKACNITLPFDIEKCIHGQTI